MELAAALLVVTLIGNGLAFCKFAYADKLRKEEQQAEDRKKTQDLRIKIKNDVVE